MKKDWEIAEKEFEQFFSKLGKEAFVHRLTDTRAARNFVAAQPSDYLVVSQGDTFFCEVKTSKSSTSFSHHNIQPKQLASARRVIKAGGSYLFFIKSLALGKWFILPAQVILNATKKSTAWSDISQYEWKTP